MNILHDLHTHTMLSSCCSDPEATADAYIKKAHEMGYTTFGFSDHLWDEHVPGASSWYSGQSLKYVLLGKKCIPDETYGIKVLYGAEAEYWALSNTLAITAEDAKSFDYILVPHTHTHMRSYSIAEPAEVLAERTAFKKQLLEKFPMLNDGQAERMSRILGLDDLLSRLKKPLDYPGYVAEFLTDSFEKMLNHPEFIALSQTVPTIIAHPFGPCEALEPKLEAERRIDFDKLRELCKKAAGMSVAFDINLGTIHCAENGFRDDSMIPILKVAKEAGIKFALGTDSHTVAGLDQREKAKAVCSAIGITDDDWMDLIVR